MVTGTAAAVTIQAFGFTMILAGPGQSLLTVGQYSNAVEYPSNGRRCELVGASGRSSGGAGNLS
jgi:hypothetical protein